MVEKSSFWLWLQRKDSSLGKNQKAAIRDGKETSPICLLPPADDPATDIVGVAEV